MAANFSEQGFSLGCRSPLSASVANWDSRIDSIYHRVMAEALQMSPDGKSSSAKLPVAECDDSQNCNLDSCASKIEDDKSIACRASAIAAKLRDVTQVAHPVALAASDLQHSEA